MAGGVTTRKSASARKATWGSIAGQLCAIRSVWTEVAALLQECVAVRPVSKADTVKEVSFTEHSK